MLHNTVNGHELISDKYIVYLHFAGSMFKFLNQRSYTVSVRSLV